MSYVDAENTGREGFTAPFSRTAPTVWEASVTFANPDGPQTWTLSRGAALYLGAFALGNDDPTSKNMARAALVVWANESGWGRHEYRWNGWGCHCFSGSDCMRFGRGDPELAAFRSIEASVAKWWEVALRNPDVAAQFRMGGAQAAIALSGTDFGSGRPYPRADAESILARVNRYLDGDGTTTTGGGGGSSSSNRTTSSGSGAKWLAVAAVIALLAAASKGRE